MLNPSRIENEQHASSNRDNILEHLVRLTPDGIARLLIITITPYMSPVSIAVPPSVIQVQDRRDGPTTVITQPPILQQAQLG
jgi:hypothetical protein